MNKASTKMGALLTLVFLMCSMQAQATSFVSFTSSRAWYQTYFYVKLPTPGAEYIPADTKGEDGQAIRTKLPTGTFVCIGITVSPWVAYDSYYFKVLKDGHYALNFAGTSLKPTYTSSYYDYEKNGWKEKDENGGLSDPIIFKGQGTVCDQ